MKELEADYANLGIMVADDKPFIRGLIQSMLLKHHARNIKHAGSGNEAMMVLSIHSTEVDCVICDWNMEPINGLELLKLLRSGSVANVRADLPFVMLTGHADSDVVNAAKALDVSGYLVKPVSLEKLVKALNAALNRKFYPKDPEHYLSVPLIALPNGGDNTAKPDAGPWIFWPRAKEKRQEMAVRVGQLRNEAAEQLKARGKGSARQNIVNARKIKLDEAAAGVILAEDFFAPDGTLILGAGVRLTDNLLARLHSLVEGNSKNCVLKVGDLAAA